MKRVFAPIVAYWRSRSDRQRVGGAYVGVTVVLCLVGLILSWM